MPQIVHHLFSPDEGRSREIFEIILNCAPELAASKSIENIEAKDILKNSGVSKSTFYKLFGSVDGVFKAITTELANDLIKYFKYIGLESPDYAVRVATKTRLGIRLATQIPLIGRLLLKVEWHGCDANNAGFKDVERDIFEGIKQGRFSDVPTSIGVNIVVGGMKAAVREIIEKRENREFADRATMQILIGLGVDARSAYEISKMPVPELPSLTKGGVAERISTLENHAE